ncbi:hypothetical protein V9T40_007386 [Parthenolecanium corni]|uniref:Uncharacterized protein n=1 Tax=Parthenolecanium corni TaxID=536013 RepID=A0AAN9U4Y7_9HEMI
MQRPSAEFPTTIPHPHPHPHPHPGAPTSAVECARQPRTHAGIDFVGSRHSNGTQQHAHTDTRPAAAALLSVLANSPHDHSHSPVGSVSVTLTAIRDFGLLNHGYSYGYGYVK